MENPPAFPNTGNKGIKPDPGMTLRDWFAGQAMPVVTALLGRDVGTADMLARDAYTIADAMLAARETAPAVETQMQHVGYYDEDGFDWMTGIRPRNCELYAARAGDA